MKLVCHYFAIFSRPVLCLFDPSGHCSMPFPINPGRFWSPESELPIYQFNRNLKILDLWHRTQSMMERLAFRKTTKKTMKAASSKQIPSWFQNSNQPTLKQNMQQLQTQLQRDFHGSTYLVARNFCDSWLPSKPRCNLFPKCQGPPRLWTSLPGREEMGGVNWSQWVNPTKVFRAMPGNSQEITNSGKNYISTIPETNIYSP